jgi:hypothetical protein
MSLAKRFMAVFLATGILCIPHLAQAQDHSIDRVYELSWRSFPAELPHNLIDSWSYHAHSALKQHGFQQLRFAKRSERKSPQNGPIKDLFQIRLTRHFRAYQLDLIWTSTLEPQLVNRQTRKVLFLDSVPATLIKLINVVFEPIGRLKNETGLKARLFFSTVQSQSFKRGRLFRLIRRRRGRTRGKVLAWTLFEAKRVNKGSTEIEGVIQSGRAWTSDEARYEDFAIPVKIDPSVTLQLLLVDRQEGLPLRGYQLFEKSGKETEYRGVTDGRGRLDLTFSKPGITEFQIRFNSLILARFPVAPAAHWRDRIVRLRLKRREDLSGFHRDLSRVRQEIEELLLLREVALEDVQKSISERKYVQAQKTLKTFKGDASRIDMLKLRVKAIENDARAVKQDLSSFVLRLQAQIARDEKRLDVTLVEAQLTAMKDRVTARKNAEQLILEANNYLGQNNVPMALLNLRQACLADPNWVTPRTKLEILEQLWKVKDVEHRNARDLVQVAASWDWKNLKARLGELKLAIAVLKRHRDELALRGALRILTDQLTSINDKAKEMLGDNKLKDAKTLSQISLDLGPLVDEISAFLKTIAQESQAKKS